MFKCKCIWPTVILHIFYKILVIRAIVYRMFSFKRVYKNATIETLRRACSLVVV